MSHEPFIAACRAHKHEAAPLLAYADWLAERGYWWAEQAARLAAWGVHPRRRDWFNCVWDFHWRPAACEGTGHWFCSFVAPSFVAGTSVSLLWHSEYNERHECYTLRADSAFPETPWAVVTKSRRNPWSFPPAAVAEPPPAIVPYLNRFFALVLKSKATARKPAIDPFRTPKPRAVPCRPP